MLSVVTTFAQTSLDGTWSVKQTEKEVDEKQGAESTITMIATYVFSGNSYNVNVNCVVDISFDKGVLNVAAVGSHSGAIERNGNELTLVPDKRKKPLVEVTTSADNVPGGGIIKSLVVGPFKREITNGLKEVENYRIVSITRNELVLEDVLTDKEIKEGTKAETITLTRQ